MNKENGFTPKEAIAQALDGLYKPWRKVREMPPTFSIKEISRTARVAPSKIVDAITKGDIIITDDSYPSLYKIVLEDLDGASVNGNLAEVIRGIAPYKRAVKLSRYKSRAPGGGPVVKQKLDESKLQTMLVQLGRERLRVGTESIVEEDLKSQRDLIKEKQAERALKRYGVSQVADEEISLSPEQRTSTAVEVLSRYNILENEAIDPLVVIRMARSLREKGCMEFVQFTCPRIDAKLLLGQTPEAYLATNPLGNNFETTVGRLLVVIKALSQAGIDSWINIVIGDTDEDDYLFPVIGEPNLDKKTCEQRKATYQRNFIARIGKKYPRLGLTVDRWSEIRELYSGVAKQTLASFSEQDVEDEVKRMREIFAKGNYYDGFITPDDTQMRKIVELKFKTYAWQGYVLSRFFPNAVLLQNEFPLKLRTRMLNVLNDTDNTLPAVYPYGRSESPY